MALNQSEAAANKDLSLPPQARIAPAWLTTLFFAGLVLLYWSQNGIEESSSRTWVAGLAVLLTAGSTLARFAPPYRGAGGAAPVARLMVGVQGLGLFGVALSLANTEFGLRLLHIDADGNVPTGLTVAALIAIGVSALSLLLAEVALRPMRNAATVEVPRVLAAAASGAVLAAAGAYGALFVYAAAGTEAQADFSYFKTSEPGEATVKLVQKMATPLQVTGFFPEISEVRNEVRGYLNKLKERSGNVEFSLMDRYLEPKKAEELKITQDGTLVLQHGETSRTLFIGTEIDKVRSKLVQLDKEFNTRLNKIARDQRVAYLTVGHGELNDDPKGARKAAGRSGAVMRQLLEQQNYRLRDLGLNQGLSSAVPDDADLVLVLGPSQPFTEAEIGAVKRYADGGGKVFMALDIDSVLDDETTPSVALGATGSGAEPATEAAASASASAGAPTPPEDSVQTNPRFAWLVQLAAAVGAKFEPALLADESKHVVRRYDASDRTLLQTNRFSTHASVSTLSRNSARAGVVAFGASHLGETAGSGYGADVTVRTFATTFLDKNRNFALDPGESTKSYNLGVALSKKSDQPAKKESPPAAEKDEPNSATKSDEGAAKDAAEKANEDESVSETRAFVFADADAFSDLVLSRAMNNRLLAFDAIRWLVGEESLAGEVESEEDVKIETSKTTDTMWFYLSIFGLPALVLAAGLFVSHRAKRTARKLAGAR